MFKTLGQLQQFTTVPSFRSLRVRVRNVRSKILRTMFIEEDTDSQGQRQTTGFDI